MVDDSTQKVIERTRRAFAPPTPRQLQLQQIARAKGGLTPSGIARAKGIKTGHISKKEQIEQARRRKELEEEKKRGQLRTQALASLTPAERQLFRGEGRPQFKSEREVKKAIEKVSSLRRLRPQEIVKIQRAGISPVARRGVRQPFDRKPISEKTISEELKRGTSRKEIIRVINEGLRQKAFTSTQERRLQRFKDEISFLENTKKNLIRLTGAIVIKPEEKKRKLEEIASINKKLDELKGKKTPLSETEIFKDVRRRALSVEQSLIFPEQKDKKDESKEFTQNITNLADEWNKATTVKQKRKIIVKAGIQVAKEKGFNEIVEKGDKLMRDSRGINFVLGILAKSDEKDRIKASKIFKSDSAKKRAINYLAFGTKDILRRGAKSVLEKPLTLSKIAIEGILLSSLITKGLKGAVSLAKTPKTAQIISGLVQLGTPALKTAYAVNLARGYKKATDKQQYIIDSTVQYMVFGLMTKRLSPKKALNLKKAIASLNPFYRGDIKLEAGYPQTTSQKLARSQGKLGNFYHVTSSKTQKLIRDKALKVISQKTGLGKDRLKFGEDFLYLSNKGLVQYGVKGTQQVFQVQLDKELKKLVLGDLKTVQSSNILKGLKIRSQKTGQGKLTLRSDADKLLLDFAKKNKLIIGGQRASNLQLPKKFSRETFDWDFTSNKDMTKLAKQMVKKLNKFYGTERFKLTIKRDGALNQILDTVKGDHIADFSKPFFKQKFDVVNGLKVVTTKQLMQNKINTLSDKTFQRRWDKDLKDLKSILKASGDTKSYKQIVKKFESDVFKGKFDPKSASFTKSQLKTLGFSDKASDFMVNMRANPLKYSVVKLLLSAKAKTLPTKFEVIEFADVKVGKFPQSLQKQITLAGLNKLSPSQQTKLRIDMVAYAKKHPREIFPSPKTVAGVSEPFGLEEEWITAVGGKFGRQYNIRSKILRGIGIRDPKDYTVFDDVLDKVIPVRTVSPNTTTGKGNLKDVRALLKLIIKKYKNPAKLIKFISQEQLRTRTTLTPEQILRSARDLPANKQRRYGLIGTTKDLFLSRDKAPKEERRRIEKVRPRVRVTPKIRRVREAPRPKREVRRPTRRVTTTRRTPRKPRTPRQPPRTPRKPRTPRQPPRTPRKPRTPRQPPRTPRKPRTPRQPPRTPRKPRTPRRPPIVPPKIPPPKTPPPPFKFFWEEQPAKIKGQVTKKKKKKELFEFTPTLGGLGELATRTKGTFTGFETRGSIVKLKPVKVKKYKRRNVKAKFVKRHRRRSPIKKK